MLTSLPSYSSHYLAPIDLNVTLSVQTHSSTHDDSSSITDDENLISRPATSSPKRSGIHNLRREGYSEEKCRYVLVKYCSGIPRNFNYAEGMQLVYEKLREHCGDENLDLSIGVLYEFIEVDTEFTFEQGAAFRRWQFDHSRRAIDLTNNHAPRMGNIIVGNIIPTERLRQWRNQNPDRQRGVRLSDSDSASPTSRSSVATVSPHFGILHRSTWHIENTLYVSSMRDGTRVQYCPSPQELHERAWNESYGRGGKLVRERCVAGPNVPISMDFEEPDSAKPWKKKRILQVLLHAWAESSSYILKIRLLRGPFTIPPFPHVKCDCLLLRHHKNCSVPEYEGLEEVVNLPDQDSEEGKTYYRNIKTISFPDGVKIPNSMFARKHELMVYNEANEAQVPGGPNRMRSVEDLAIQKCLEANNETTKTGNIWTYRGPLTASLFKDSGIDYQWDVSEISGSGTRQRAESIVKPSAASYLSQNDERTGDIAALRLSVSPARRQRARSLSKRALQGGKDMIRHEFVTHTVDENNKDASRPYASWLRNGTQAHLFSGNPGASSMAEAVGAASGTHFDRFAAQFQNKFTTSGPRPPRARGLERPAGRPEVGIRKRTAESVQARKQLLKKIVTFDGTHDIVTDEKEEGPLAIAIYKENNNNNNNRSSNSNNHKLLSAKPTRLAKSILRSSFIRKLSIALEYNFTALASRLTEHKMSSAHGDIGEKIQVNGVFLLKSPQPLVIRKLSGEEKARENGQGSSRQKQVTVLESMPEEPQEQRHNEHDYPPRTSSRHKDGIVGVNQKQRRRSNTDSAATRSGSSSNTRASDDSFMGNFVALGESPTTPPSKSSRNRNKGGSRKDAMVEAEAHHRRPSVNTYELQDSPQMRQLTHMTTVHDFLSRKFQEDIAEEEEDAAITPPRHTTERPPAHNRDPGPWSTRKATGHAKNSSFDVNGNRMERRAAFNDSSTRALRRAEYQQEHSHEYGLHRTKSSPAIGVPSNPAPTPEIKAYAAYETSENDESYPDLDFYSGGSHFPANRDHTASPVSRGRPLRPRGLGIDSMEPQVDVERREGDRVEVFNDSVQDTLPAPKRARSPMKKLFGPGGFLGNTGAPNSPADPRYVKPKTRHGMVSKIKTKIEEFAEIPRNMSPVRNLFKSEEKTETQTTSKHPVSLSPPRQAKLYMELELLICATTNNYLMDQFKAGRMSPESMKKIGEFWKSKGRPQVIEFQYDQATQRDLIVANQRDFKFHGDHAHNALQVNAMLYTWKQNAREMSVRTFCTPDTVIQKQLHDTYRMLELLGAGFQTFIALQDIHKDFNKQIKKAIDARRKREIIKQLNGVERRVVLPETPVEPMLPSPSRGGTKDLFFNTPVIDSQEQSSDRITDLRARLRPLSDVVSTPDPLYPSRMNDPYYAAPIVKRGPYADQSDIINDYYPSQAARPSDSNASHLPKSNRLRAHQQDHYNNNVSYSTKAAQHSQYDHYDSTTSYSSRGSGSRNKPDHQDSMTSYSSHAANSIRPEDSASHSNSYYSQHTQPRGHGRSDSYATQVTNARMHPEQRGSTDTYSSRGMESRNNNNRDDMSSRQGAVSPNRRNIQPVRRVTSEDSDDFSSFGKYGAGL